MIFAGGICKIKTSHCLTMECYAVQQGVFIKEYGESVAGTVRKCPGKTATAKLLNKFQEIGTRCKITCLSSQ